MRSSLKHKLADFVHKNQGAVNAEEIKKLVLKQLDVGPDKRETALNWQDLEGIGRVYPIHWESDMTAVY